MPEIARAAGPVEFTVAAGSDPGRVRDGNEDRIHVDAERGIFVMVDGVGGHAAGEVAAEIAVDVIVRRLERPLWAPERRVREAIALANNEIFTQASAAPERSGMTCVLTLALLTEQQLTIGHVGDTRLYRLNASGISKLTHDHSPIGEREDGGEITEAEAMRHPRRNEVFRDVGSAFHEPDDPDFIEVVSTPFDERSAILMCSDGLSDMLTTAAIDRIVRQHAGMPERVVEALIQAANEAGGKDNVSVIYLEGARFALDADLSQPAAAVTQARELHQPDGGGVFASRATWLAIGLLVGLAGGMGLTWLLERYAPVQTSPARRLSVGASLPESPDTFASISAAMQAAAPRDTVIVEPGEYQEAVVLKDGVDLIARVPGSVTLTAAASQPGWIGITGEGRLGNRVSGLRIRGTPDAPMAIGLHLAGHGLQVDDVDVEGRVEVAVDIVRDGNITVQSSRIRSIDGVPLRVGSTARPVIRQNLFVRRTAGMDPAAVIAADAQPELTGNVFDGYTAIVDGPAARNRQLFDSNYVVGGTRRAP
jgi:serine/threonine protein phosphatase PrpC